MFTDFIVCFILKGIERCSSPSGSLGTRKSCFILKGIESPRGEGVIFLSPSSFILKGIESDETVREKTIGRLLRFILKGIESVKPAL